MLIPQTVEYALRALAHLATLARGESVKAQELAEATNVPLPYLWKIMRRLVLAQLVESHKGHGGGFALLRRAASINIQAVLVALDCDPATDRCAFGWETCDPDNPCLLHPAWSVLNAQFRAWAGSTTLADLVTAAGALPRQGGSR